MALTKPFAEQGEKKAISLTPDAEGTMNYQDGFGQRYSLPVKSTISEDGTITTTGGLWIQREQFNQLMFDTTSAIIENQDNITQLNQDLGDKGDLTTTNKDNIVSAINELDSNIGDLQDLTTTEKSNVVSAVNEIDSNYVRLDTEQTIPSVKTFSNVVNFGSIVNVNGEANFNNNVEMVNTPTITNPKTFQDLIDNELITKAQSVSKFVDFDTNQSVSGLKTFTTLPQSDATPTNDKDLTTKLYVDTTLSDKIAEIGKAMGFKGIVENATDLPTDTATDGDMYYNKASSGETEDNKKGFYVFNGTAFDFIGATISMDFDKIFEIEEKQGDLTQLKTTAKDSLVNAINENYDNIATNSNNIGTLGNLTTTAKDNLVNAINENKASIDTNKSEIDSSLGDLTQLKTTAKDSLVNAINENYDSIETNSQHIAENEGAISTINDNIGDLQNLTTTAKTSVVNAINEIDNSLKNNHFVTLDTNQTITSLKTFDKLPQSSVTPANDTDLVTKAYVDTQVADIDTTNLAKLDSNNQFTGENTFDIIPKSNGTPANDTDLATKKYIDDVADNKVSKTGPERIEGVKTFASIPLCSPQPTANIQLANKAYVDKKVSKTGDETIQGNKTFSNPPICNTQPTDDNQLANKAYVDSVTGGFAGLDKANTFTQTNTFEGEVTLSTIANTPTITNPNEWATLGDNGIPTKKQIIDNIQGGGGGGNYLPLNIDTDTEVTTTAGSNAQLSLNFTDSTIAQGATFEISNQEHNIQFSKDAGINNIKLNQNLEFKLDSNINADVIFSDDYTKQKFKTALEIGSAGVTLDTEQTITGNKFFQADENATAFMRFYPTPTQIEGGGSNYVAHATGYVLVGKDESDYNTRNLIFDVPTQRGVIFTNSSGSRIGSVGCEDSTSTQGFNVSYNVQLLGKASNNIRGSFFCDLAWDGVYPSKGNSFMGLGEITDGNNECGAFIATPYNFYITLVDSTSKLVLNDKAKSEFQRVLEIPSLSVNNTWTGTQTFNNPPVCNTEPTNDNQLANKAYVDSVVGSGDSIPLSISNQMATYDATTLQSVKYDFGNNTYSIFGTSETSFTTKTRTSGNLEKTADVIIGTAGAYAIPDDLLPHFGLSMKEMGQIPIGFSVTSNGNNIGGLGIGGTTDALVLWGGKTTAGTGANCLSIQPSGISLIGQSARGNAGLNIAGGGVRFDAPNSLNFNLGNSGTLTMSPKMISELKRLLGIS